MTVKAFEEPFSKHITHENLDWLVDALCEDYCQHRDDEREADKEEAA